MHTEYLIVGQGLAGTWLSFYLQQAGKKVVVVDRDNPSSASRVSSGIVNPITGRKLVKSWLFDTMYDFAQPQYQQLGAMLGINVWHNRQIIWLLHTEHDLNNFSVRSESDGYTEYIEKVARGGWGKGFTETTGYAQVKGSYVDTPLLVSAYRKYLQQAGCYINDWVAPDDIRVGPSGIVWKHVHAKQIIFCEGYLADQNPYFSKLPFAPNKGEVLVIEAPKLEIEQYLVKGGAFIVPLGNGRYWAGSQYNHDTLDEIPTPEKRTEIEAVLQRMLAVPYRVVQQMAAVRPCTDNRRPLIGIHPLHPQIAIFNGLGTKGVLISVYFAHLLSRLLLYKEPLPPDVDIAAYLK